MELDYYLWKNKLSHKSFAKKVGIAPHSLSVIVNKKRTPLLTNAIKIHYETAGAVSLYELMTLEDREEINKKYGRITQESVYNPDRQNDTEQSRRNPGPENEDNSIRNRLH
jgi:DNA-binding XRE family transcriptional regulator